MTAKPISNIIISLIDCIYTIQYPRLFYCVSKSNVEILSYYRTYTSITKPPCHFDIYYNLYNKL